MVTKKLTKTLTRSTINGYTIKMENGKPVPTLLDPVIAWGKLNERESVKILEQVYGKESKPICGEILHEEVAFEIAVETFVAHATEIEAPVEA